MSRRLIELHPGERITIADSQKAANRLLFRKLGVRIPKKTEPPVIQDLRVFARLVAEETDFLQGKHYQDLTEWNLNTGIEPETLAHKLKAAHITPKKIERIITNVLMDKVPYERAQDCAKTLRLKLLPEETDREKSQG